MVSLLACLVSQPGRPRPRAHLAELLWPDSEGAQARTDLRRELHHLRALFGDSSCLIVDSQTLCWQPGPSCVVDVHEFLAACRSALVAVESAEREGVERYGGRVLALYRGPFLPGCCDDWVFGVRQDLRRTCVDLCDRVAAYWLSDGDLTAAAVFARRRVLLEPLEEPGYRLLMRVQRRAGDRAGAMRTYHQCASLLERELGVSPSPDTCAELDAALSDADCGPGEVGVGPTDRPPIVVVAARPGRARGRTGPAADSVERSAARLFHDGRQPFYLLEALRKASATSKLGNPPTCTRCWTLGWPGCPSRLARWSRWLPPSVGTSPSTC